MLLLLMCVHELHGYIEIKVVQDFEIQLNQYFETEVWSGF